MVFPDWLQEILEACTQEFREDIPGAALEAYRRAKLDRRFKDPTLREALLVSALQHGIHDIRHSANTVLKRTRTRDEEAERCRPSMAYGTTSSVQSVYQDYYNYYVAGKTLGNMTKEELLEAAESEQEKADGHLVNVSLFRELEPLVGEDQTVREAVSQRHMKAIWDQVMGGRTVEV